MKKKAEPFTLVPCAVCQKEFACLTEHATEAIKTGSGVCTDCWERHQRAMRRREVSK